MSTPQYPPNPGDDQGPGRPAGGPPRYVPSGDQHGAAGYGADQYGRGPGAAGPPPPEVGKLLTLTLVSGAIYLLSQVLTLITGTDLAGMYEQSGMSSQEAATMAAQFEAFTMVAGIVGLVLAAALYGLVYVFLKKGRNWARVLGIVLAVLSVVSTVAGLLGTMSFGGTGVISLLLGVVFVVVNVLWLLTAVKAPVKAWYNPQTAI